MYVFLLRDITKTTLSYKMKKVVFVFEKKKNFKLILIFLTLAFKLKIIAKKKKFEKNSIFLKKKSPMENHLRYIVYTFIYGLYWPRNSSGV